MISELSPNMIRTTLIVHGKIQKSDYRGRVIQTAKDLDITGYVQNLVNGDVKIVAEGNIENITAFVDEIDVRNFLIKVTSVDRIENIDIQVRDFESFYKMVGTGETDDRLDAAAEVLKELAVETKNGFKEQREYNKRTDEHYKRMYEHNLRMDEHNMKMDVFIVRMDEHNMKMDEHNKHLEKILEKLIERK